MQQNESQIQTILDRLILDDQPDAAYRQTLRQSVLQRFDERQPAAKRLHFVQRNLVQYAAAVVVLSVGAAMLFLTVGKGPGIAFADVQRQLRDAKTILCILSVSGKTSAMAAPGKEVTKTLIVNKKGEIVKTEVKEKELRREEGAAEDVHFKMKIATREPGLSRVDILAFNDNEGEAVGTYTITDSEKGKTAFFQTKQKLFVLDDAPGHGSLSSGFESVFRQCMDTIKTAEAEPIGEKKIDGRNAKGYKIKNGEVWADARTAAPILIKISSKDPQGNVNTVEISDIRLNEPLEDSLFSMEIPEGYTDLNHLTAEDFEKIKQGQNSAVFISPSVQTEP